MLDRLKRHPFSVVAHFRHSLVLTYAFPRELLATLLPPGLVVDSYGEHGFLAIAMVETEGLRPAGLPRWLGQDFVLTGYRIFCRFRHPSGHTHRGLRILRSDTDKRRMVLGGNLFTHYNYKKCTARFREDAGRLEVKIATPGGDADLEVVADLASRPAPLPPGSPFPDLAVARRFAGPLPYTFDSEEATGSIVMIRATRESWDPQPVQVEVKRCTFLEREPFRGVVPILANAFHVHDVDYRWERGVVVPLAAARESRAGASREAVT